MIRWLDDLSFGEEPLYDANLDEDDLIWEWRGIIPFIEDYSLKRIKYSF